MDIDAYAEHFPELRRDAVYLNAAGRTPLPARTLAIGTAAVARKAQTPWDIGDTEADKDEVRALFAQMLHGARASDIAVVPSCSYAMTLAARNLASKLRQRPPERRLVLVLQDQNPSNVMQWQRLCDDEHGELCVVRLPEGPDEPGWANAIVAALESDRVAVAAVPPCHWCDGSLVDLVPVAAACKVHDVALVVDATQWVGAAPALDVAELGITFLACSVHKWLMGPYGACLCYAPPSFWQSASPLEDHDRNREGAADVECLPMDPQRGYPTAFQPGCRRLDGGGRPSFIVMPMLVASLKLLVDEIGVPRVTATLRAFTTEVGRRARAMGFRVPTRHAPHIVGLRPAAGMPSATAIVDGLKRRPLPILVGARLGAIRIAPYLYNGRANLEALCEALLELSTPPQSTPAQGHHSRL